MMKTQLSTQQSPHLNRPNIDQVASLEEARNLPLRCDENDCFVFFSELDGTRRILTSGSDTLADRTAKR